MKFGNASEVNVEISYDDDDQKWHEPVSLINFAL